MGLLSLAGIIINNAILLLDRIADELSSGKSQYDAIIAAAQKRLRPIVMTKLTCILGLVPLMLFGGELWYRSEEHTSELQSLMRISYAVFCLKKKKNKNN